MEPLKGKKVNLYLDEALWQDFRVACIRRHISASHAVSKYMNEQLDDWTTAKEGSLSAQGDERARPSRRIEA